MNGSFHYVRQVLLIVIAAVIVYGVMTGFPAVFQFNDATFALIGGLYGIVVAGSARPRASPSKKAAFVVLSMGSSILAPYVSTYTLGAFGGGDILMVVAATAFVGSLGFALLVRRFWNPSLSLLGALLISAACAVASGAALWVPVDEMALLPAIAVPWWLTFTAGLFIVESLHVRRRLRGDRCDHPPTLSKLETSS